MRCRVAREKALVCSYVKDNITRTDRNTLEVANVRVQVSYYSGESSSFALGYYRRRLQPNKKDLLLAIPAFGKSVEDDSENFTLLGGREGAGGSRRLPGGAR